MKQLNTTSQDLQENRIKMIGFEEVQKERELKISTLKRELAEIKMAYDTIDLKYQTHEINYKKIDD